ncbi:MAG: four helix bundle protein [Bacteroidetes bacterium]|nr:four helix bundle protein [Bacteroidota bacterium]
MGYTERKNLNRGYMKLDVWNDAINLFQLVNNILLKIDRLDFKLKAQILDAAQSISSNIAEGYCRRSINEYLQFLSISLGSSGELMTRIIGLKSIRQINEETFEELDKSHYSVENKLLNLIKSLQLKRKEGTWDQEIH